MKYYDYPDAPLMPTIFADGPALVPAPYGGLDNRVMDAFGGWVASAIDLVRFSAAVDGQKPPALLRPETIARMVERPAGVSQQATNWTGLGWSITANPNGSLQWWHDGSLPGTRAFLAHTPEGFSIAVLFNGCPAQSDEFLGDIITALNQAFAGVRSWPQQDLFPLYGMQ